MKRVCHFSTVHSAYDVRIFYRECVSLAANGYEVDLLIKADTAYNKLGVNVFPIKGYQNRIKRFLLGQMQLYRFLFKKNYDLYHFHDPELIPTGVILFLLGKKVVYDVHENVVQQIKTKDYLPLRTMVSKCYGLVERIVSKMFFLILAEDSYENHYRPFTSRYQVVLNMPDLTFFRPFRMLDRTDCENGIFYIGGISENRGVFQVIKALNELKNRRISFHFHCIGRFDHGVMEKLEGMPAYEAVRENVTFYGPLSIEDGFVISQECKVGVSILKPIGNYEWSYSTKIFEYMAVGLPVITSNFQLYRQVVERHRTGMCVDPLRESEISMALENVLTSDDRVNTFAQNGVKAVEEEYYWGREFEKLLSAYNNLIE
ncbi:MAG: glycosyltransferase [Salibacteraceae bacterium]